MMFLIVIGNVNAIGVGDLNIIAETGFVSFAPSATGRPAMTDGVVHTISYNASFSTQTAYDVNSVSRETRTKSNGTWSAWVKVGASSNKTVLNASSNSLSAGTVRCSRVGDLVTISGSQITYTSSGTFRTSDINFIPAEYLPPEEVINCYSNVSAVISDVKILTNGQIAFRHNGSTANSVSGWTISYVI